MNICIHGAIVDAGKASFPRAFLAPVFSPDVSSRLSSQQLFNEIGKLACEKVQFGFRHWQRVRQIGNDPVLNSPAGLAAGA
jgi:hypothetical protein